MILADLGAEIIRIDRSSQHGHGNTIDFQHRSKSSLSADLKNPQTINEIKKLLSSVDGLIEGFRPKTLNQTIHARKKLFNFIDGLWIL